jgi:hypothetical protein
MLNLLQLIMHPISLLYFVHCVKLLFQLSVYILGLLNGPSRLSTILAAFVTAFAVFPLGHFLAPVLAHERYSVELDPLFFSVYFCLWYVYHKEIALDDR